MICVKLYLVNIVLAISITVYISQIIQCRVLIFLCSPEGIFYFIALRDKGAERGALMREGSVDRVPPVGIIGARARGRTAA